jgi:hypothetical protein
MSVVNVALGYVDKRYIESSLYVGRSEWLRAQTLESWVRIPVEVWMFVYVYSVFVLSCVCT